MSTYATPEELKASPEYKALGIIGRERMLFEHFPDLEATYKAGAESRLTEILYPEE